MKITYFNRYIPVLVIVSALFGSAVNATTFQGLGFLPGGFEPSNQVNGISADGTVVIGTSNNTGEAFLWTRDDGMVGLGSVPSESPAFPLETTVGAGVSSNGEVIVGYGYNRIDFIDTRAIRWVSGQGAMLPELELPYVSKAYDVSADGSVVIGEAFLGGVYQAFRWTSDGGYVGLGDLPGGGSSSLPHGTSRDGAVIVGEGQSVSGNEAFMWTTETGMVGLGFLSESDTGSEAWNVSSDGTTIVGAGGDGFSKYRPFAWTSEAGMIPLGGEPGIARAVSGDGSVVVGSGPYGSTGHTGPAFIWNRTHGRRNLQDMLVGEYGLGEELTGWYLVSARAISDDGLTIAGFGDNPDGYMESWIVTIPEPSAGVLLALVCCIGMARRS